MFFEIAHKGVLRTIEAYPPHGKFESPFKGFKAVEVTVEFLKSSVRIKSELIYKYKNIVIHVK